MNAMKKMLGVGSTSAELKQLQEEHDELMRILISYRPELHPDPKLHPLLKEKRAEHCRRRAVMEQTCSAVRVPAPQHQIPDPPPDAAQWPQCEWGRRWKPLGAEMPCERQDDGAYAKQRMRVEWGQNMRLLYFDLDEYFLNSASYGATPRPVQWARTQWDLQYQQNPTQWRLKGLPTRLRQVEARLARELKCEPANLKLLLNCNAATSCVLKALPWEVGDRLFIFSVDYDATKNACRWLERTHGVEVKEVKMVLPLSDDQICELVETKLQDMMNRDPPLPKLANFCHVTSKTAYIFPAQRLRELFHKYGVPVLIDGAQAAGHLPINIAQIGADWYVGTVHKWMYSCQGVAFIVADPQKHEITQPLTISAHDGEGFQTEFDYVGLQDFSTWCCVIEALDFADNVLGGFDKIREHLKQQAAECVSILGKFWGTKPVQVSEDGANHYGNMPIMPLPNGNQAQHGWAPKVMGYLAAHGITAFLLVQEWQDPEFSEPVEKLCIRCSCQVYTDSKDWSKLGQLVKDLGGDYGAGKVLAGMLFGGGDGKDGKDGGATAEADTLKQMSA